MRNWKETAFNMLPARVVVAIALLLLSHPLFASVAVPAEFGEIVRDAALIVRGRVTDVRAVAVPRAGIDSIVTVAVDAVLKGQSEEFISVRVPGGELGRYRFVVVGAPTLRVQESGVFFLARGADNSWRPVGLSAGVARAALDTASGRLVIRSPVLAGVTASAGAVVRGDARRRALPVPEFDALVRAVVAVQQNAAGGEPR